jgi:tetratricopeptide (TPR) repeat protein
VPLEPPDQRFFEAACGYLQLAMPLEANEELEKIDPFNKAAPEVLALRIEIYRKLGKWDLMREIAKRLNEFQPDEIQWVLSYAFATRRAVSIEVAKQILLKSVAKFPKEAAIFFNLACYECQLGQLSSAMDHLRRAFQIDPRWRLQALEDEDLKPVWNFLRATD